MFDKLDFIVEKHAELNLQISDPEIISDQKLWQKLMKEHAELTPIVEKFTEYKNTKKALKKRKKSLKMNRTRMFVSWLRWSWMSLKKPYQKLNRTLRCFLSLRT